MANLIPGFRFYPTEEELVLDYMHNKLDGTKKENLIKSFMDQLIPVINIYDYNPWDLQQFSGELCHGDTEQCFFFIPRQESQARGGRPNRLTSTGYWKATGSPSYVYSSKNRIIGVKRTMVFYVGRAPSGNKTEWKMNEYKAIQGDHDASSSTTTSSATTPKLRQEYSLCRVYKSSKCTRAFDRRPIGVEITSNHGIEGSTLHRNTVSMENRVGLSESSSLGDHGEPSQGGGNENRTMNIDSHDLQDLWDWNEIL